MEVVAAVGNIDTSGVTMLGEVKNLMERRGQKVLITFLYFS